MQVKTLVMMTILPLSLTLSGCVISVGGDDIEDHFGHQMGTEEREYENRKHISDLELDMSQSRINSILGVPDFTEFYKGDKGNYSVLFYRTHRTKGDGKTTKDECTPLVLLDDKLIGWGETAYSQL